MTAFKNTYIATSILLTIVLTACSSQKEGDPEIQGRIPKSWYDAKANANDELRQEIELPDQQTDQVVKNVFDVNYNVLDQSRDNDLLAKPTQTSSHPANWTPWHLDGMVGYYAISQGGVLGALLYSGTESIKLTWQKATVAPVVTSAPKPASLLAMKVTPDMTSEDIPTALEPSIRIALASGAIKDESVFRRNILLHAEKFFNLCQIFNTISRSPGWYVDGYQLNVNFSASGQVTPLVGVGGSINLYFDWSRTTDPTATAPRAISNIYPSKTTEQLNSFVRMMSAAIPEAVQDSAEIEKRGFHLDLVQVGLGITAGGDVGVVQATGGDIGRILFKRDMTVVSTPSSMTSSVLEGQQLNLVSNESSDSVGETSVKVDAKKFSHGLKHAIKMASYFAEKAKKKPNSKYKLNQIEAEFDTSLSGDLKLATVNGIGQFVLDFDLIQ